MPYGYHTCDWRCIAMQLFGNHPSAAQCQGCTVYVPKKIIYQNRGNWGNKGENAGGQGNGEKKMGHCVGKRRTGKMGTMEIKARVRWGVTCPALKLCQCAAQGTCYVVLDGGCRKS